MSTSHLKFMFFLSLLLLLLLNVKSYTRLL